MSYGISRYVERVVMTCRRKPLLPAVMGCAAGAGGGVVGCWATAAPPAKSIHAAQTKLDVRRIRPSLWVVKTVTAAASYRLLSGSSTFCEKFLRERLNAGVDPVADGLLQPGLVEQLADGLGIELGERGQDLGTDGVAHLGAGEVVCQQAGQKRVENGV